METRQVILEKALRSAAAKILEFNPKTVTFETKTNLGDLVTKADLESERVVTDILKQAFPHDLLISEEVTEGHALLTENNLANLTCWVLDPIDGTNNFKRNMGYSCISLAYVEKGIPIVAGILNPYRDEFFGAEKGKGAFLNGQPIHVSTTTEFTANTRVVFSNTQAKNGGTKANMRRQLLLPETWVDALGSAILIITDIAAGRLDLYHHNGLKPWDFAGSWLVAEEAGAAIVGLNGQKINWLSNEVVVGNSSLVDKFIEITNP